MRLWIIFGMSFFKMKLTCLKMLFQRGNNLLNKNAKWLWLSQLLIYILKLIIRQSNKFEIRIKVVSIIIDQFKMHTAYKWFNQTGPCRFGTQRNHKIFESCTTYIILYSLKFPLFLNSMCFFQHLQCIYYMQCHKNCAKYTSLDFLSF